MKAILVFNTEDAEICVARILSEQDDPKKSFESYFIKSVCDRLEVTRREAKQIIEDEDDDKAEWWSNDKGEFYGTIFYSDIYREDIQLKELPKQKRSRKTSA